MNVVSARRGEFIMNKKANGANKIFYDLRNKTASFNTGIALLNDRIEAEEDYSELIPLMEDSLEIL